LENIQKINIDIVNHKVYEYIYSKQWDEGRIVEFNITDDNKTIAPTNYVMFQMKKPDGYVVLYTCEIIDGKAKVVLSRQMTAVAGKIPYQLNIYSAPQPIPAPEESVDPSEYDGNLVSTVTGYIIVEASVVQPDDVESKDEFNVINEMAKELGHIADVLENDGEKIIDAANDSIEYAKRSQSYAVGGTDYDHGEWEAQSFITTLGYVISSDTGETIAESNCACTTIDLTDTDYIALQFRTSAFENQHYGYGFVLSDDSWSGVQTTEKQEIIVRIPEGAKAFKVGWDTTATTQLISATKKLVDDDEDNAKYYYEHTKDVYNKCVISKFITLYADQWENDKTQTVEMEYVMEDEELQLIVVRPREEFIKEYHEKNVLCIHQGDGFLVFSCDDFPDSDIDVFIMVQTADGYDKTVYSNVIYAEIEPEETAYKVNDFWVQPYE
jgi:hypothetical protein